MRIAITGAGGQLGQALLACLRGHEVHGIPRIQLDVTDFERARAVLEALRPDLVINTSAYTDVDGAEADSETAYRVNAVGPRNLAVVTHELGVPLVHISTDFVFDGEASRPYHEFDPPHPLNVYGASKLAGEREVRALNPRHYIVRTAWLYDIHGRNFPAAIRARAAEGPLKVVGDQFGSPTYAPHLAEAIARLIRTGAFGTYHLAGAGTASRYEFALAIVEALGLKCAVEPIRTADAPRPARRPRYAPLRSLQEPRIELPPWREGVSAYARALRESGGTPQ